MATTLTLHKTKHPDPDFLGRYDALYGMDAQKLDLLASLEFILAPDRMQRWQKTHHPKGLGMLAGAMRRSPLVILSGDVGCGKTELASTIGSKLSKVLGGETIMTFETPSNIRGTGLVGEVSARITAAFADAKSQLGKHELGILVIDEADDLATTRSQSQAHHEDRAGVNALIKEIDGLERSNGRLAVILITNRPDALDPAVMRRAARHVQFERPDAAALREIWEGIALEIALSDEEVADLVDLCLARQPRFTYSDIFRGVARTTLITALAENSPISYRHLLLAIDSTPSSPTFTSIS